MNAEVIPKSSAGDKAYGPLNLSALMTRARWAEVARIVATGFIALLFWQGLVPIELLWLAVAVGLYLSPLGWEHINLTGDYLWRSSAKVGAGKFRPLRPLPPA